MSMEEFCLLISNVSNVPYNQITPHSSFRDDLGIDSLSMVNLIIEVTEAAGLDMRDLQYSEDMSTVGSMYQSLVQKGKVDK